MVAPPRGQFPRKIPVPEIKRAVPAVPLKASPGKKYRTEMGNEHVTEITEPEFKRWVMQFDTDRDGRISRKELREAIRRRGAWFAGLRARFAVRRADRNRDGFVDDSEIEGLIHFAETELGFRVTAE